MGMRDASQLCTSIQHHLHHPGALAGTPVTRTLGLRAQRQPGEKLEKAPTELEVLIQPVPVIFWRVFGFWGASPERSCGVWSCAGMVAIMPGGEEGALPPCRWGGPCRAARTVPAVGKVP